MACIERVPRCGEITITEEPINEFMGWVGILFSLIGILSTILGYEAAAKVVAAIVGVIGIWAGAIIAGVIGAGIIITVVYLYHKDRCTSRDTPLVCIAGVVQNIVQELSGALEYIFPFTAMHDRIDLVVKSNYWDIVENNAKKVFCTEEPAGTFRTSEIMRCYYYTPRVCSIVSGALVGAVIGGIAGVALGAAVAVLLIGCSTIVLCLIAILVALVIAAAVALLGAAAGGLIVVASSDNADPSDDSGTTIGIGSLITVNGNILTREYDEGANVIWWVTNSSLSGMAPDGIANNPFSYCDINDIFAMDACPRIIE